METKYTFTKHAKTRFLERFWNKLPRRTDVMDYLNSAIENSTEERSFLNNTNYMTYVYEKYGYRQYKFLRYEEMLFLTIDNAVVTILEANRFPISIHKKYKKEQKIVEENEFDIDPKLERMVLNRSNRFF